MEYKMGCGSYCDPTFAIDSCNKSAHLCPNSPNNCQQLPGGTNSFAFSTESTSELRGLRIDYIHVTFFSDSSVSCGGFEGMFVSFDSGWNGDVRLGDNQDESMAVPIDRWLASHKDYIPGYPYHRKLPDFKFYQTYSASDRLKIMARSLQDPVFRDSLKNHTIFGPIVD
jgi:hypothetical protein